MSHVRCGTCAAIDSQEAVDENHCRDCHRSWRGHAECHCAICHRHFGGDVAFLAHQADGICRDPAQLKTKPKNGSPAKPRFRLVERKHSGPTWIQNDERQFAALGDTESERAHSDAPRDGAEPVAV